MNKQPRVGDTFVYTQAMRGPYFNSHFELSHTTVGKTYVVSAFNSANEARFESDLGDNRTWVLDEVQAKLAVFTTPPKQLALEEHCATQGALKFDEGKVDYSLAPGKAIGAVCQALEYGAGKYGRDNYRKPPTLSPERLKAGVLRHLLQDLGGELLDPESGLPHTYHAAAGLAMLHETTCEEAIGARYEAPDENVTKD